MTRPTLPKKKKGDVLGAKHVNKLSAAAESGRIAAGGFGYGFSGTFTASANPRPWEMDLFEVTKDLEDTKGSKYKGMFEIQPMYYNHDDGDDDRDTGWQKDEEAGPFEIDTIASGLFPSVGDQITAYFDTQRDAWVPVVTDVCHTWVDVHAESNEIPNIHTECGTELLYGIEGSKTNSGGWGMLNQREYSLSWTEPSCNNAEPGSRWISGTGIYSFGVFGGTSGPGTYFLRIPAVGYLDDKKISVSFAALRIKGMCSNAIQHSLGPILEDADYVGQMAYEQRSAHDTGAPKIEIISKTIIKVEVPKGSQWNFQAELSIKFLIEDDSSSSSPSSSGSSQSASSQSSSSPSSASSASSESSSVLKSSSSSVLKSSSSSVLKSSASSDSSSAFDCYSIVSDVTFDEATCELTVCRRTFCWPKGEGPSVSGEDCS